MKQTKTLRLFFVLAVLLFSSPTWAGSSYYKNLSFTVKNPETAKGIVYLAPYTESDNDYCEVSKDPKVARVRGNMTASGNEFKVKMFALPADGYVLDCLTSPKAYASKKYHDEAIRSSEGYPLSSLKITIDNDTASNCTFSRPKDWKNETPVYSWELYSYFIPATKATVKNSRAGALEKAVKSCRYGERTNTLVVKGPLSTTDFKYLNKLSREKGLIRLDA